MNAASKTGIFNYLLVEAIIKCFEKKLKGENLAQWTFTTLGLTDPSPWAGNGRAQWPRAVPYSWHTCMVSKKIRNLAQRAFRKVRTLIPSTRKCLVHHVWDYSRGSL